VTEQLDEHQFRSLMRASRCTVMDGFTLGFGLFLFGVFISIVFMCLSAFVFTGGLAGALAAARQVESKPSFSDWLRTPEKR
jgi:hypothetical protein